MSEQQPDKNIKDSSAERKKSTWVSDKNINLNASKSELENTNTKASFLERWENSRFLLIKGLFYLFKSVWIIVMAIGSLIAWLIAVLFI